MKTDFSQKYRYLGDKWSDDKLKNQICFAVKNNEKCITAQSKMLVYFRNIGMVVVIRRRLRKIP